MQELYARILCKRVHGTGSKGWKMQHEWKFCMHAGEELQIGVGKQRNEETESEIWAKDI